jgi:hypothetical protein
VLLPFAFSLAGLCYTSRRTVIHKSILPMPYSRAFFALQLTFARQLSEKFHLPLAEAYYRYTTLTKSLHINGTEDWHACMTALERAPNALDWIYQRYLARREQEPEPAPDDTLFYGHPLFGCFYYIVRDSSIIRPHFVKNDLPGVRPLSQDRLMVRRAELQRMFTHIRHAVPQAQTVLGNSWMYNLEAYRRLYPPAYTASLPVSEVDEFEFLALWGQCYDYDWRIKDTIAQELLRRVDALTDLSQLRLCFPYQILRPQCPTEEFYDFYGIT